jgi:hypothetical protein
MLEIKLKSTNKFNDNIFNFNIKLYYFNLISNYNLSDLNKQAKSSFITLLKIDIFMDDIYSIKQANNVCY